MNTRWHLRQLRRRETPAFDPAKSIALWRGGKWTRPTEPVLSFSEAQLSDPALFPDVMRTPAGGGAMIDSMTVRFGDEYLQLQDLATLALIKQNLGKRPIYFSWSDGPYPDQTLGLGPYLVTQGLVRKLNPRPVTQSDSIVPNPTLGALDLPRTRELLWNGYHWKAATQPRSHGWVDVPSSSIMQLYTVVYGGAAQTLKALKLDKEASQADSIAAAVEQNINRRGTALR
jgi:hypothetical protein